MSTPSNMAARYPAYYKDVSHLTEIDVYTVHFLFKVEDPSGALQHASKKLLLSGVRTGGKSKYQDIKEARDTLNRWLDLHANAAPVECPDPAPPISAIDEFIKNQMVQDYAAARNTQPWVSQPGVFMAASPTGTAR